LITALQKRKGCPNPTRWDRNGCKQN